MYNETQQELIEYILRRNVTRDHIDKAYYAARIQFTAKLLTGVQLFDIMQNLDSDIVIDTHAILVRSTTRISQWNDNVKVYYYMYLIANGLIEELNHCVKHWDYPPMEDVLTNEQIEYAKGKQNE